MQGLQAGLQVQYFVDEPQGTPRDVCEKIVSGVWASVEGQAIK